jgi:hypothetical protein
MKKKAVVEDEDDPLDREIDFSNARPNPYFLGVVDPRRVRVLDEDLAEIFPDYASVNAALRTIADAGKRALPRKRRSARTAAAPKTSAKKKVRS